MDAPVQPKVSILHSHAFFYLELVASQGVVRWGQEELYWKGYGPTLPSNLPAH